jgi:NADH-quinone oxidoreductase subunit C
MSPQEIAQRLAERLGPGVLSSDVAGTHPHAVIDPQRWLEAARLLREDADLAFDFFRCLSAVDYPKEGQLACVYDLISTTHRHAFAVKVFTPRADPRVPSVAGLWPTANWHEREAFDLMGIVFDGHPELRRILLPEDWQGHPLRKDYVFPKDYNGIPCASLVNP